MMLMLPIMKATSFAIDDAERVEQRAPSGCGLGMGRPVIFGMSRRSAS